MRIVLDMQGAQTESRFRGIGRYTISLAKAIVRNRGEHEIILALSGLFPDTIEPVRAAFDGLLPQENIRVWHAPGPVRECQPWNEWRREVAECIREAFLAGLRPDIIHVFSLFEGFVDDAVTSIGVFDTVTPVSVTLYDLIPLIHAGHYFETNSSYKQYYMRKLEHLKKASLLLAVSDSSRREALAHLGVSENQEAIDEHFHPLSITREEEERLREKFGILKPFVLYAPGGFDVMKNVEGLIRSYAQLSTALRQRYQLVIAGKISEGEQRKYLGVAKQHGLGTEDIVFTGYVSDEDLVRLYNLCEVFVFPSIHEGFGLPVLEAMACGAAVIGSNTTSIPEVIGRTDALFDPHSEHSIAEKLEQVLTDEDFRNELKRHGIEQAKRFSWDESAKRAINAFEVLHQDNELPARLGSCEGKIAQTSSDQITCALVDAISAINDLPNDDPTLKQIANSIAISCPFETSEKQLLVDISELVQRDIKTGIQRVVRSILKELLDHPPEGYRVEPVYATMHKGYRYARRFALNCLGCETATTDEPVEYSPGDLFFALDFPAHVVLSHRPFYQQLRNNGVQVWFLVHDLLPITFPHAFGPGVKNGHHEWLRVVAESDGAICVSRSTADELAEWYKSYGPVRHRPFKIHWSHNGADISASLPTTGLPADAEKVLTTLSSSPSFLMVGTIEPRKSHAQVLAAFELLWAHGMNVNLVIVGKQGWLVETFVERLRHHKELGQRLFWLEGISDEYLEKVYAASTCLLMASEGEGFGLPLIEAAQHKLPILARDIPVFREVAGEHAFYFSGLEPEALAKAVKEWLELYKNGRHPKSDKMPWLTWRESTRNLVNILLGRNEPYLILKTDARIMPGAELDFMSGRLNFIGWSVPEPKFRWSLGNRSLIEFETGDLSYEGIIRLLLNTLGKQRVRVFLNDILLTEQELEGADIRMEMRFSPSLLRSSHTNQLVFELPDARRPNNGDSRALAIALKKFILL
jgi:glycosyltransferase involved in cell wall biosynthesis